MRQATSQDRHELRCCRHEALVAAGPVLEFTVLITGA